GQVDTVVNDPVAKAYWLQVRNLYSRLEFISLTLMIGLRVSYWTIGYIRDRQVLSQTKETDVGTGR
ncbi:MAG: hypothetical protein WAL47_00910, partial [Pyrinomonadaceae bacterium]